MHQQQKWQEQDFYDLQFITGGPLASIYKAVEKYSNKEVVLKMIQKYNITNNQQYVQLRREIEIHSHLNHINIIKMFGYFETEQCIFIVLEYAKQGNLYEYMIQKNEEISEKEASKILLQLLAAVDYLHHRFVIHRDIKLENILIQCDLIIKLADFGQAVHSLNSSLRDTQCGTLEYIAPEILQQQSYNNSVDSWSIGIILFELFHKKSPFLDQKKENIYQNILLNNPIIFRSNLSDIAISFIQQALNKNPSERLTINQMINHPFLSLNK